MTEFKIETIEDANALAVAMRQLVRNYLLTRFPDTPLVIELRYHWIDLAVALSELLKFIDCAGQHMPVDDDGGDLIKLNTKLIIQAGDYHYFNNRFALEQLSVLLQLADKLQQLIVEYLDEFRVRQQASCVDGFYVIGEDVTLPAVQEKIQAGTLLNFLARVVRLLSTLPGETVNCECVLNFESGVLALRGFDCDPGTGCYDELLAELWQELPLSSDKLGQARINAALYARCAGKMPPQILSEQLKIQQHPVHATEKVRVYEGEWSCAGQARDVAVKLITLNKAKIVVSAESYVLSKLELTVMCRLSDQYCVNCYGYYLLDDQSMYGIVMEWMPNESLHNFLHRNAAPLTPKQKTAWVYQTAVAVAYLHSNGIVHADIKSDNLLLNADWQIRVADFGFVGLVDQPETLQDARGTLPYCAPEVLQDGGVSYASDVFSCGVVFWEIYHREVPWREVNSDKKLAHQVVTGKRLQIDEGRVSSSMAQLIRHCWVLPKDRITTPGVVKLLETEGERRITDAPARTY